MSIPNFFVSNTVCTVYKTIFDLYKQYLVKINTNKALDA